MVERYGKWIEAISKGALRQAVAEDVDWILLLGPETWLMVERRLESISFPSRDLSLQHYHLHTISSVSSLSAEQLPSKFKAWIG